MTTHNDMLFHLGGLPVMMGVPFGKYAKYYFVDPANGSDSNDGRSVEKALATLAAAEDKCVANQHDTVFYIAGSSGINMSAALTWDKNYTHLFGICAPSHVGQRARLFQLSTLTGASPLLNITASGCMFKNFYQFQGVNDATSLINVQVTGGRNYFENVHFAGGGHATQAIDGGASLKINGGSENKFVDCTIGVDTIAAGDGMANIIFDGAAARNRFEHCTLQLYAGHIGAKFVEIADNAGFDRTIDFINCRFINDAAAITMTEAFTIPAGMGSATHRICIEKPFAIGFTDWDSNDRGLIYIDQGTITGGGNAGIAQVAAAT